MQTREIPREQWIRYFDDFSKGHEGWIVTLELLGPDIGDQEEVNRLPLVGISADVKAHENRIEIIVGGKPDADVTRFIERPTHVWVKESRMPGDEAIEIESEDGLKTLLNFHHIRPEETERQLPAGA
jgi:Family of unknown function (DUF5335)